MSFTYQTEVQIRSLVDP